MKIRNSTFYNSKILDFSLDKQNEIAILTQKYFIYKNLKDGGIIYIEQFKYETKNSKIKIS